WRKAPSCKTVVASCSDGIHYSGLLCKTLNFTSVIVSNSVKFQRDQQALLYQIMAILGPWNRRLPRLSPVNFTWTVHGTFTVPCVHQTPTSVRGARLAP